MDGITDQNGYQSNAGGLHKTTTYSYDGDNQGSSDVSGYDYGNVNQIDVTANDVNGEHFISTSSYYPNDNVLGSLYLTNLPARTSTYDASGTEYGCHVNFYGDSSSYTAICFLIQ